MNTPYVSKDLTIDILQETVSALRSGTYKQGQHRLRTLDDAYCCLGVICDIAADHGLGHWEKDPDEVGGEWSFRDWDDTLSGLYLPTPIRVLLPFNASGVRRDREDYVDPETGITYDSLASANDRGVPFPIIAGWIEEMLNEESGTTKHDED